ncbi:MAG TPA: anti-sigma factor [Bryobacteraceae bacterium]|nr:anti-sigma factor [Bryobacteraceae bacterium]
MNCSELRDHYELYALGLAEEPERDEIRAHLDRGCEVCMSEMRRARELLTLVGGSAVPAAPSRKLRRRILASVGVDQRGFGWTPLFAGLSALLLAAALYFAGREGDYSRQVETLTARSRAQIIELTRLNEAFALMNGADTTVTTFGEKKPVPKGKLFYNPSKGALLIASNLPQAPAGKAYELWLIPKTKGAPPIRDGMFQSDSGGTAMRLIPGPIDANTTAAIAVTMEVDAGVDAPTSPILIFAPLAPALQ